jgi:hypothetical protein
MGKRKKQYKRCLILYKTIFGFREPYQILGGSRSVFPPSLVPDVVTCSSGNVVDETFVRTALQYKMSVNGPLLRKVLGGEIRVSMYVTA